MDPVWAIPIATLSLVGFGIVVGIVKYENARCKDRIAELEAKVEHLELALEVKTGEVIVLMRKLLLEDRDQVAAHAAER